jgi:DNA-binding IclR family transcriptional regulator
MIFEDLGIDYNDEDRHRKAKNILERKTNKTVPDLSALEIELAQCRKDGWAIEHGQSSIGYSCLAVALSDQFPPINSLSISMQTKALTNKYRDMLLPELFSLAKKIIT